jgi:exosortase
MPRDVSETDLLPHGCASKRSLIVSARPAVRHVEFLPLWILSLILLRVPVSALVNFALHDERYSLILLIPFISGFVVWLRRKTIFVSYRYCPTVGMPVLLIGTALLFSMNLQPPLLSQAAGLRVAAFAIVLVWTALFVLCYGMEALRHATFPFLFLLLMVPIPMSLVDNAAVLLQKGSAEMSYRLFELLGIPVFRVGFKFTLPGVEIQVAEECSGVRSSFSLFIASILACHLFLRSKWNQLWFVLFTIPVLIFKNAVRIVTISSLSVYVDRGFLFGNLHHRGGLPFSLIAVAILAVALLILQKSELGREKGVST